MPGSDARPLPERDLDHVLQHTQGLWEELRGGRIFMTGGTGFFGRWMLESFLRANDLLGLGAQVTVLTRAPGAFTLAAPHVARHEAVSLHEGDVRSFDFPALSCSHVLHMATETELSGSARASFQTAVLGTSRVLDFAVARHAQRFLLTSSGAVYGPQPPGFERVSEDYRGAPDPLDPLAGYAHGKRAAEFLCSVAARQSALQVQIARCFAFVGPLLPLDSNFAIGNFIGDALYRDRIEVQGDGTARRSYLYAADLAVWLWTILFKGKSARPYNVGSEEDLSIAELARVVARVLRPAAPADIYKTHAAGSVASRYVPSVARACGELDLHAHVDLPTAVRRTADWYSQGPTGSSKG